MILHEETESMEEQKPELSSQTEESRPEPGTGKLYYFKV